MRWLSRAGSAISDAGHDRPAAILSFYHGLVSLIRSLSALDDLSPSWSGHLYRAFPGGHNRHSG